MSFNVFRCTLFISLFFLFTFKTVNAQIGFSYFIPEKGSLSIPVAPFSYTYTWQPLKYFKLLPSAAIFSIGGMSVTGLPAGFDNSKPLMGPFYSISLSLMPQLSIPMGMFELDIGAGYFGSYNLLLKVNNGNMDRMMRMYEQWDVCNTEFTFTNNISHGFIMGGSLTIWLNKKKELGIAPGLVYYMGSSKLKLKGNYSGGIINQIITTKEISFPASKLNYKGYMIQIGVLF